jgi:hypothetical protein
MKAGLFWATNAADRVLVEVAEFLSFKRWGAATDSGDLDMSAGSIR